MPGNSTTYEYILMLNDKMTGTLKKAGYLGGKEYDKLQAKQDLLNKSTSGLTGMLGKLGLAFGVFEIGKKIITAGADIEQTRVSFATFMGSVEKGNAMIKNLQNYADVTPFTADTLQSSAKMLLGFGVAGNKIMPTLKMLGDISGGNADKMQSLTLAFAQMSSAGKLNGQDLLQMINAGFNPLQVMSQKTGKSMSVLRKEMEAGAISSAMVEGAFQTATAKGGLFYGMMDKMGQTVKGRWSTLIDSVNKIFRTLGENGNSTIGGIIDRLSGLAKFVSAHLETITKWGKRLIAVIVIWKAITITMAIATAVQTWYNSTVRKTNASLYVLNKRLGGTAATGVVYSGIMGVMTLATNLFSNSIRAIGKAIYSVPIIGWIAAGIAVIVALVTLLWNKSEKFRGIIYGLGAAFKVVWEYIKLFFKFIYEVFKGVIDKYIAFVKFYFKIIKAIGTAVVDFFVWIYKAIAGWLTNLWTRITSIFGKITNWIYDNFIIPIQGFFQGLGDFFSAVWDQIMTWIKTLFKPFIDLWNSIFGDKKIKVDIIENYKKGYQKGVANFRSEKAKKASAVAGLPGALEGDMGAGGMGAGNAVIEDTAKGISDGGNRPTNITINLKNLVESLTVSPATMKEGASEIERMVKEALLRVLNSANGVAYGN